MTACVYLVNLTGFDINLWFVCLYGHGCLQRWRVDLILSVDEIKLTLADRRELVIPVDKKRLFGVIKHQVSQFLPVLISPAVCSHLPSSVQLRLCTIRRIWSLSLPFATSGKLCMRLLFRPLLCHLSKVAGFWPKHAVLCWRTLLTQGTCTRVVLLPSLWPMLLLWLCSRKLDLLIEHEKIVVHTTTNLHSSVVVGENGLYLQEAPLQPTSSSSFILGSSLGSSLVERINRLLEQVWTPLACCTLFSF